MATTYTLIKGETLASNAASYTFSAIPGTYTDLELRYTTRVDASGSAIMKIQIAGADTSLSHIRLIGDPSGGTATSGTGTTSAWAGYAPGSTFTANTFNSGMAYIPNYSSTSQYKQMALYGAAEQNATDARMLLSSATYSSNSAITSISIVNLSGFNLVAGSSFYLYGIKSS